MELIVNKIEMIVRGNLLSDPALPMHHPTNKARQIAVSDLSLRTTSTTLVSYRFQSARPAQVLPVQTMNLFLTDSPRCRRDESMRKDFSRSSSPLVRRQQPLSPKLSSLPSRLPDPFDMTSRSSIASRTKPVRTLTSLVRSKSQLSRYSHRLPELHSSRFNPEERSAISQSLHVDKMQLEILKKKSVHPHFTTDECKCTQCPANGSFIAFRGRCQVQRGGHCRR